MALKLLPPKPCNSSLALALGLVLAAGATACADDTVTDAGGDEVSDETETETDADTETETESGDSSGETETTEDTTEETDTGVTEVDVSGEVTDFVTLQGIPNANIAVLDMPGFEAMSDEDGNYAIDAMPPDTEVFFLIDGNEPDYWGGVRPAWIPAEETADIQLGQISDALIDIQLNLAQMQNPDVMKDETKAIVIVRIIQPVALMEGPATVTFDPPLPDDQYFGVNADDNPVLGSTDTESSLLPLWVAFNLDPADFDTYTVDVTHPTRECTVLHPSFPTFERFVTVVDIDCPPAP